jgi:hypothetical protein
MITVELRGADEVRRSLAAFPRRAEVVLRNSLNDTATHVRAESVRRIRADWNVKADTVRRAMVVRRATQGKLEAEVRTSGAPLPLIAFGARQTKRGVTTQVKKGGARVLVAGAFIATMASGHRGVFRRVGKPRLPIGERKVISIPSMWQQSIDQVQRDATAYLERRTRVNLERAMSQLAS